MMESTKIIKTNNITKIYGDKKSRNTVTALSSINMVVEKGEFVGVMGASGSGKTTLLNILSGMMPPTTGTVEINQTAISSMDEESLALFRRRHIGYVFQDYRLLNSLTLQENIMLPMVLDNINPAEIKERTSNIIDFLGLEGAANQYSYQTSGGQKQRTAIGRALINRPSIIFADEPTGNLDTKVSKSIMENFVTINKVSEQTILMVTHDPKAASYCNRIIFIKDGGIHLEIIKKEDQKKFFEKILDCLAVMGDMYTTIYLNNSILREITRSLKDILVAICIAIILFTICFFNYAYSSLLKSRNSEFGLLMGLGMMTRDIKRIVFIENTISITISSIFGLLVGTVFSRLFFMAVRKVIKADNIKYQISVENYFTTMGIFLAIYISIIFIKNQRIKKLSMIELTASGKTKEKLNVSNPLLGVFGVILILFAYGIVYLDAIKYTRIPEKSTYFTIICFTGLYLVISQFGSFFLALSRLMKKYYFKNMLSLTEMNFKLSRNKDMMYILTLLVSITLFFLGFAYSKYVILEVEEGDFLVFISSLLAVLFFTASVGVIYFKLFSEIDEERIRYQELNCIGITKKEVKRYINCELAVLLFTPIVIGMTLVFPYMSIEYLNSAYKFKIMVSLVLIFLLYSLFNFIFYIIIKRKYRDAIVS